MNYIEKAEHCRVAVLYHISFLLKTGWPLTMIFNQKRNVQISGSCEKRLERQENVAVPCSNKFYDGWQFNIHKAKTNLSVDFWWFALNLFHFTQQKYTLTQSPDTSIWPTSRSDILISCAAPDRSDCEIEQKPPQHKGSSIYRAIPHDNNTRTVYTRP